MINSYFQNIVDEISNHGGDVLKFAGDAVFAEWRISNDSESEDKNRIYQCVHKAASCGAEVVAKCSDFPVFNDNGKQIATLNVHCGLAYGEMAAIHVGNDYNRREFIVLGQSIDQVTKACSAASYGELSASPEAFHVLQEGSSSSSKTSNTDTKKGTPQSVVIASRNVRHFKQKQRRLSKGNKSLHSRQKKVATDYVDVDKMDIASLKHLKKLLSLYVHPVIVSDESVSTKRPTPRDASAIQERHRSEAELRSVYTVFIKPLIPAQLTKDTKRNRRMFKFLNNILNVVTSILDGFRGHLRQYIVDDKGDEIVVYI